MQQIKPDRLKTFAFWRDLLLYFCAFSWLGHWLEIGIVSIGNLIQPTPMLEHIIASPFAPYHIYGFAVVLMILLLQFYPVRVRTSLPLQYAINTTLCAIVEYIAGTILLASNGYRNWDYSEEFMNLNGHICLQNTLFFGAIATIFSRFLYPLCQRGLEKIPEHARTLLAVLLGALMLIAMAGK